MKKIILFGLMLCLLIAFVNAGILPTPVSGILTINGERINGVCIRVENINTGDMLSCDTIPSLKTENGLYMFDLSEFPSGYVAASRGVTGDKIRITACASGDSCVKEFEIPEDFDRILIDFNIGENVDVVYPDCPSCPACDSCCEECPVPTTPEDMYQYLIGAGGMGVLGVAIFLLKRKFKPSSRDDELLKKLCDNMKDYTGFRIIKWNGAVRIKHLHPSVKGYHDPTQGHKNPKWNHESGKVIL